jgi:glycerate kinase
LQATAVELGNDLLLEYDQLVNLPGGGSAGGLGGALAALGAQLVPGVELIDDEVGLAQAIQHSDLVVTAEGFVDHTSFAGKVIGGVAQRASRGGKPVVVIGGQVDVDAISDVDSATVEFVDLTERFGFDASMRNTKELLRQVGAEIRQRLVGG